MAEYTEAQRKAQEYYRLAESTAHVAFKVVQNPKLMLPMVENVFLSMTNSMTAILIHQRLKRTIPSFNNTFDSKCITFKSLMPKISIDRSYLSTLLELKEIIVAHQKSPVEFTKGNSIVICSDNYSMKVISPESLRTYLSLSKKFLADMEKIINE